MALLVLGEFVGKFVARARRIPWEGVGQSPVVSQQGPKCTSKCRAHLEWAGCSLVCHPPGGRELQEDQRWWAESQVDWVPSFSVCGPGPWRVGFSAWVAGVGEKWPSEGCSSSPVGQQVGSEHVCGHLSRSDLGHCMSSIFLMMLRV